MKLLLGIALMASISKIPYKNPLHSIEQVIETHVMTQVLWTSDKVKCKEGIMGFYDFNEDRIYICEKSHKNDYDEIVGTLKHEGWHAVQVKCNKKRALYTDSEIINGMRQRDIKAVVHYPQIQKRLEAEARLIELIDNKDYVQLVMSRCKRVVR